MIGAIADDLTGATDVAAAFGSAGLRVGLFFGGIDPSASTVEFDVIVVGLKTRTVPADEAVARSVAVAQALAARGCAQVYVKYCSTFDSSPAGNIGPVADALAAELHAGSVVFAPTTPAQGRTVYQGHLFVGDVLLSESSMRDHPLTPMTDASLPRVLRAQTTHEVGLVAHDAVRAGSVSSRIARLHAQGADFVIVDALDDADLDEVARAVRGDRLVTGAAGLAAAIARDTARSTGARAGDADDTAERLAAAGTAAALAGSCSARTREQIARWQQLSPALRLDPVTTPDSEQLAAHALAWYERVQGSGTPLIFSSADPAELHRSQQTLGAGRAAELVEHALGLIATGLVRRGVDRLIVAGGETSGEVVRALGVTHGRIGAEAAPGVPWIFADRPAPIALLLKSGNYGDTDLLVRAAGVRTTHTHDSGGTP